MEKEWQSYWMLQRGRGSMVICDHPLDFNLIGALRQGQCCTMGDLIGRIGGGGSGANSSKEKQQECDYEMVVRLVRQFTG